jgi:hypothetical protein
MPETAEVFPHDQMAVFQNCPTQDSKTVFWRGRVGVIPHSLETNEMSFKLENYRSTFCGLKKYRSWSQLDAVYFFGYAVVC